MNDLMVMRAGRYCGADRLPGDIIPGTELEKLSPAVLSANISIGNLGDPTEKEVMLTEDRVREILQEAQEQQRAEMHELGIQIGNSLRDSIVSSVMEAIKDGELLKNQSSTRNSTGRGRGRPRATAAKED